PPAPGRRSDWPRRADCTGCARGGGRTGTPRRLPYGLGVSDTPAHSSDALLRSQLLRWFLAPASGERMKVRGSSSPFLCRALYLFQFLPPISINPFNLSR